MSPLNIAALRRTRMAIGIVAATLDAPTVAMAQSSPFLTGATALQSNIISWLTPIAVILIMALGGMAMANRIVENCGNTLILRCSASEGGGTSRFASRLIGEREVLRTTESRSRRPTEWLASSSHNEHFSTELALLPSEIEQLPDLAGLLKVASRPEWLRVVLQHSEYGRSRSATSPEQTEAKQNWSHLRAGQQSSGCSAAARQPAHAGRTDLYGCDAPQCE